MQDYKITKQLINRFKEAIPKERVINGTTKQSSVTVTYVNGFEYKIVVEKVINSMENYTARKSSVDMWYPTSSNSSTRMDVPNELQFVVDKLQVLVQTTETEEKQYKQEFENSLRQFYSEIGWK